jgi:hypothetical protein
MGSRYGGGGVGKRRARPRAPGAPGPRALCIVSPGACRPEGGCRRTWSEREPALLVAYMAYMAYCALSERETASCVPVTCKLHTRVLHPCIASVRSINRIRPTHLERESGLVRVYIEPHLERESGLVRVYIEPHLERESGRVGAARGVDGERVAAAAPALHHAPLPRAAHAPPVSFRHVKVGIR